MSALADAQNWEPVDGAPVVEAPYMKYTEPSGDQPMVSKPSIVPCVKEVLVLLLMFGGEADAETYKPYSE